MASKRDDRFEPKLGRPRAKGKSPHKFISRVLRAASKAGPVSRGGLASKRGLGAERGRGQVIARLVGDRLSATSRRVAVKARLVNLKRTPAGSAIAHLKYIERDGVTANGERGQAHGPEVVRADIGEFEQRGSSDRHQFRFIVSPEDAAEFGDLKSYTRDLMAQMERDLGTRLEWVAVDHFDTEHPHTHIVLRGAADDGKDLIIARDYISHGMRVRASELMTRSLGPRTELEIEASLTAQVSQERWTALDAALERLEEDNLFGSASRGDPLYEPVVHLGRLLRTVFLCDYFLNDVFRRELLRVLNRGEAVNALKRAIYTGCIASHQAKTVRGDAGDCRCLKSACQYRHGLEHRANAAGPRSLGATSRRRRPA